MSNWEAVSGEGLLEFLLCPVLFFINDLRMKLYVHLKNLWKVKWVAGSVSETLEDRVSIQDNELKNGLK